METTNALIDPILVFLNRLETLLNELYIIGLSGIEQSHLSALSRTEDEATMLGLTGAARLLHQIKNNPIPSSWVEVQNLRLWSGRFRKRYTLSTINLSGTPDFRPRTPVQEERIEFLEAAVLGALPLEGTGRIILYCFNLKQPGLFLIEDVASPVLSWEETPSLIFGNKTVNYLLLLEKKLCLRGLKRALLSNLPSKKEEVLLPALGTSFEEAGPVDRLALWNDAQIYGTLQYKNLEQALTLCSIPPDAQKIVDRYIGENYAVRLLLASNPIPKPKGADVVWLPFVPVAAAFRSPEPEGPTHYSLLQLEGFKT